MTTVTHAGNRHKDASATTSEALQGQLTDLIDLALQGKQAHWTVTGPRFYSLHAQFDELVEAYREWGDRVAERMAAEGVAPNGQVEDVAAATNLPSLPGGWSRDEAVATAFGDRIEAVRDRTEDRRRRLGGEDPVDENLFTEILEGLDKQRWMLQAQKNAD